MGTKTIGQLNEATTASAITSSYSEIEYGGISYKANTGAGIIDSGSGSAGSWIKYADGTMECWGRWTQTTNTGTSNLFGSSSGAIYYNQVAGRSWPQTFYAQPYAFAGNADNSSNNNAGMESVTTTTYTTTVLSPTNGASINFPWFAIGRWKA